MSATVELDDAGFQDPAGAKVLARRLRLRRDLKRVEASASNLLHLLDQCADPDGCKRMPTSKCAVSLLGGDQQSVVNDIGMIGIQGDDEREQELLQGMDLLLQFLDRLDGGLRHGLFSLASAEKRIRPEAAAHRLSGGAE